MIDYKLKNSIDGIEFGHVIWHHIAIKFLDFKNKKVLDMGCGAGGFLGFIKSNYNSDVYGIDPNKNNIQKVLDSGIRGYVGYADEIGNLAGNDFDIVTSFEVLEHVYSYKDLFIPAFNFLQTNGIFVVSTPNAFHILRILSMFKGDHRDILMDPTRSEEPEHIRLYSYNMLKRAYLKSGFKNVKIVGILEIFNKKIILKNKFFINFFSQHLVGIAIKK